VTSNNIEIYGTFAAINAEITSGKLTPASKSFVV
jgi:hypothetical protein